jgi:hypothetical protein
VPRSQHYEFVRRHEFVALLWTLLWCGFTATAQTYPSPKLVFSQETHLKATNESITPDIINTGPSAGSGKRISVTNLPVFLDTAKSKLGPPEKIRVINIINSLEVKIESSGKYSTACIHNLPPEVFHFVASMQQVRDNITALEAQCQQDQTPVAAQPTALDELAALNENRIRLRQLENESEPETTIIARPSEYYLNGRIRYWEFERMGMTNRNQTPQGTTYPSPYPY